MALPWSCSISKQDCANYNHPASAGPYYTSASCVAYPPWDTGDLGYCGWVGAPCTVSDNSTNCNVIVPWICDNGRCGFGLGDLCPGPNHTLFCNGEIDCGLDGLCGGKDALASSIFNFTNPGSNYVSQHCISGVAYNDSFGSLRCTDQSPTSTSQSRAASTPTSSPVSGSGARASHTSATVGAIVGGILGGLIIVLALLWYLWRRRARITSPPSLNMDVEWPSSAAPVAEISTPVPLTAHRQSERVESDADFNNRVPPTITPATQKHNLHPDRPSLPIPQRTSSRPLPALPVAMTADSDYDRHTEVAPLKLQVEKQRAFVSNQPKAPATAALPESSSPSHDGGANHGMSPPYGQL